MLSLSPSLFSLLNLALGILIAWSLSCLWQIVCAVLFVAVYKEQPSWEESQNAALIVNSKSALGSCLDSSLLLHHRRKSGAVYPNRARHPVITLLVLSLIVMTLTVAYPSLVALIPATNAGLVVTQDVCGLAPVLPEGRKDIGAKAEAKLTQWANVALTVFDLSDAARRLDSTNSSQSASSLFPTPLTSYSDICPPEASECSPQYPFTFTGNYTLHPKQFGLNTNTQFSIQVFDTCYGPHYAYFEITGVNSTIPVYGLFYGPVNISGFADAVHTDYTDIAFKQDIYPANYILSSYFALADDPPGEGWSPNSTLTLGGDTSLFFYRINGVRMLNYSSDPLFATMKNESSFGYSPSRTIVPIICDTKYIVCLDGSNDCSQLGGVHSLSRWFTGQPGDFHDEIRQFLLSPLYVPPIYRASFGYTAIAASQTVREGTYQSDPHVTAQRELARLLYTGMLMLASFVPLSAIGYWDVGYGLVGLHSANPRSLCRITIMQSLTVITVPALPYVIILVVTLLVVLISYATCCVRGRSTRMSNLLNVWMLYSPGQLHREVTERIRGAFAVVDTTTAWPTVRRRHLGADVVIRDKQKCFGIGVSVGLSVLCLSEVELVLAQINEDLIQNDSSSAFLLSELSLPPSLSQYSPTPFVPPTLTPYATGSTGRCNIYSQTSALTSERSVGQTCS
jgi:hypothetical protein